MSAPSLQAIASALGGRVVRGRNPHVAAPFPGKKKHDRSLHVFINGDGIGVHAFRDGVGQDEIKEIKDHVRRACGMKAWQPRRRKPAKPKAVPFAIRNHFFGETLAVCRFRRKITEPQFALLINDLRLRGDGKDATLYASEFGIDVASIERCLTTSPRHYTADERAKILHLTYRERQHLRLRRTGSIDVDKAGREKARRARYNAKRKAARTVGRVSGVNKRSPVEGSIKKKTEGEIEKAKKVENSMSNVIPFPRRDHLRAIPGIDKATGRPVRFLEHVGAQDRMVVADCHSQAAFDAAVREWCSDQGLTYPFHGGAA